MTEQTSNARWQDHYLDRLSKLSKNQLMALALKLKARQIDEEQHTEPNTEALAIVGVGCRLPGGVSDPDTYWELLSQARSGIVEMADQRWDMAAFYDADPETGGRIHTRALGLVDDVDLFDAAFFSVSPREAQSMDPQQRLLLEVGWEAVERSGHACASLAGRPVGVFVGMMNNDYSYLNAPDIVGPHARHSPYYASGQAFSIAAGRLAYVLGVHGPCMTIDTACSSSLVAVHLACRSLLANECELAIAGGTSLILSPEASVASSNARMLSPSGQCWSFDHRADGYVRGEGCAVVVLKRLSRALADGDPILAAIVGSAVNHDGRSQGLTAPNTAAQVALMRDALRSADLDPACVRYLEAHGTGTPLGDPIEMASIRTVYGEAVGRAEPLAVGSVKAQIGHTEACAGVAGLIKLALSVSRGRTVPQRNFERINPHIALGDGLRVALTDAPLGGDAGECYGAVNSFGFSGTNAHVIVRDVPRAWPAAAPWRGPRVLVVSAVDAAAVDALLRRYQDWLANHDVDIEALAYTSQLGRNHFPARVAVAGATLGALREALGATIVARARRSADTARETACPLPGTWVFAAFDGTPATVLAALQQTSAVFAAQYAALRAPLPDELAARDDVIAYLTGCAVHATLAASGLAPDAVAGADSTGRLVAATVSGLVSIESVLSWLPLDDAEREAALTAWPRVEPHTPIVDAASGEGCATLLGDLRTVLGWLAGPAEVHCATAASDAGSPRRLILGGARGAMAESLFGTGAALPSWDDAWAALYARGATLDWAALYGPTRPRRLVLPTYAFQRRRYWPCNDKVTQLGAAATLPLTYHLRWERAPAGGVSAASARRRLVLATAGAWRDASTLPSGVEWRLLPTHWREPSIVSRLLGELGLDDGAEPVDLLFWLAHDPAGAGASPVGTDASEYVARRAAELAQALRAIGQGLLALDRTAELRLGIVTEGVEPVDVGAGAAMPPADPASGIVAGFVKSLDLEQPQWRPWRLDIETEAHGAGGAAQIVLALAMADRENEVAIRRGERHSRRLVAATPGGDAVAADLPPVPVTPDAAPLPPGRAWLVTGGSGAIGRALARYLARAGASEIVMLSRHGADHPRATAARDALATDDVRLRWVRADVADDAALRAALAAIRVPISGIFHAAGVIDDAPLQKLTDAHFARVMHAKVQGALNLDRLARELRVERFVLFSSVAAVLGSAGQANYACANGFLATLAQARRAAGLPATVIHWGPWAGDGMALAESVRRKIARAGFGLLDPDAALDAMAAVLASDQSEAVIARFDWARMAAYLATRNAQPLLDLAAGATLRRPAGAPAAADAPQQWAHALSCQPDAVAARQLAAHVEATVREVLAIDASDRLDASCSLQTLGMDSLLSVELRNRFATQLGLALPISLMFDNPSMSAVTRHLLDALRARDTRPGDTPAASAWAGTQAPLAGLADPASPSAIRPVVASDAGGCGAPASARAHSSAWPRVDIAVIGMACRMPGGADDVATFWDKLCSGADMVAPFDDSRWDVRRFHRPGSIEDGKMIANAGGQLADVHGFDNRFFGIADREAEYMDPQQRVALEVAWETLEAAGYTPEQLADEAGVFIGPGPSDFADLSQRHAKALVGLMAPGHHVSAIPGRIAHLFDWRGPCMAIDTACSSSLVAVHVAAQHLREGECRVALAGGVNLILSPANNIVLSKAGMLSPGGRCRVFDAAADGYVRSDGCAMVLLKRLDDALADGDAVLGVIRGSAVNHNGQGQGFTAPSSRQQARVITTALARAGIDPREVRYVEAHGTGTRLGDAIEMAALKATYGVHRDAGDPLDVGALKSAIGHTESAAGVAGLIKILLMMAHRKIPPTLHLSSLNPNLEIDPATIRVPVTRQPLRTRGDRVPICALSSFGFSGTNAHMIVEGPPPLGTARDGAGVFVVSARTPAALAALCERHARHLDRALPPGRFADACDTSLSGRRRFEHALCFYPADREDLVAQLRATRARLLRGAVASDEVASGEGGGSASDELSLRYVGGSALPPTGAAGWRGDPRFARAHADAQAAFEASARDAGAARDAGSEAALDAAWFCTLYALGACMAAFGIAPDRLWYRGRMWLAAAAVHRECALADAVHRFVGHDAPSPPARLGRIPLLRAAATARDGVGVTGWLALGREGGPLATYLDPAAGLDDDAWRRTFGSLWASGRQIDWRAGLAGSGFRRVALPTYPFEHRDCARPARLLAGERSLDQLLAGVDAQ